MTRLTVIVPDELSKKLKPYQDNLADLIAIGLKEVKIQQALSLFKEGKLSLWKAARMSNVSLREMISHAVAQGLRPPIDNLMLKEELE